MKKLITCLMLLSSMTTFAQGKYTLLERGWHRDPVFTDTITKDNIKTGYWPVYTSDLDSLLKFVGIFRKLNKHSLKRTYFNNEDFKTVNISFDITNIRHAYGDLYNIDITSNTESGNYKLRLANETDGIYTTQSFINDFYDYIKKTIKAREKLKKKNSINKDIYSGKPLN